MFRHDGGMQLKGFAKGRGVLPMSCPVARGKLDDRSRADAGLLANLLAAGHWNGGGVRGRHGDLGTHERLAVRAGRKSTFETSRATAIEDRLQVRPVGAEPLDIDVEHGRQGLQVEPTAPIGRVFGSFEQVDQAAIEQAHLTLR